MKRSEIFIKKLSELMLPGTLYSIYSFKELCKANGLSYSKLQIYLEEEIMKSVPLIINTGIRFVDNDNILKSPFRYYKLYDPNDVEEMHYSMAIDRMCEMECK